MNNQYNNNSPQPQEQEEESFINIDFKKLLNDILKFWWLFVIALAIAYVCVWIYHKYKHPIYRTELTILVDEQDKQSMSSQSNMMEGFMLNSGMRNIDNQLAILSSRSMVRRVVESMGIYIAYYHEGRIVTSELYGSTPFTVVMDSTHAQPLNAAIYLKEINSNEFKLNIEAENVSLYNYATREGAGVIETLIYNQTHKYGEPIITDWGAFTIIKNNRTLTGNYLFRFMSPEALMLSFRSGLNIIKDEENNSSVVTLSIHGTQTSKCAHFLNQIANTYINDNLAQKNLMAENTIKFIKSQLGLLSDTLVDIGTELSSFRVQHGLQTSVSSKGEKIFSELQNYEKDIQTQNIIIAYYDYLNQYFAFDSILEGVIAPAMYDTKSPIIATQLNQIMQLNAEKQAYQDTYGKPTNPASREITAKLQIARNTLLQSIENHKQMTLDNIKEIREKEQLCRNELMSLPETERKLLGIDRKFTLNNEVYNYLLRKRSESQIQKASNTPDHKIIDEAYLVGKVSPNEKKNTMMGLAIAVILPLAFLVLRQLLDNKLRTLKDIEKITKLPIIGEILSSTNDSPFVVMEKKRSLVSESFRRLRTRIDFLVGQKETPVITLSSSLPSDGKTFCAINTALVYAMSGKKTVLIGADLRKPGLMKLLGIENHVGISNYSIGQCSIDDMIYHFDEGLDIIPSGVIPPNPAEILAGNKTIELIEILKSQYDVILIDTPPMSLVSDAYLLTRLSDVLIFICRQDYTAKDAFKYTTSTFAGEGINNVGIVFNDINNKKSRYGYGYGYGYGYSYGYGYGYGYGYTKLKRRKKKDHNVHHYYSED